MKKKTFVGKSVEQLKKKFKVFQNNFYMKITLFFPPKSKSILFQAVETSSYLILYPDHAGHCLIVQYKVNRNRAE